MSRTATRTARAGALGAYLADVRTRHVRAHEILTHDEACHLATRARAGDADAAAVLAQRNLLFVVWEATKFQGRGLAMEDLVAEGNVGLLRAVDKWDPTRGIKFISYAVWWVRQAIMRAITEQGGAVRLPLNRPTTQAQLAAADAAFRRVAGRAPTPAEVASLAAVSLPITEALLAAGRPVVSLDAPVGGEHGADTVASRVADDAEGALDGVLRAEAIDLVRDAVAGLPPRLRAVMTWRFGLDGAAPVTLDVVAARLAVTRTRAGQIEAQAKKAMRRGPLGTQLAAAYAA